MKELPEILCQIADAIDRGVPISNAIRNAARALDPEKDTNPHTRREAELKVAREEAEKLAKRKARAE